MSEAALKPTPTRRRRGVSKSDSASAHGDAWLISLCDEYAAIEEEHARLWRSGEEMKPESPEAVALERLCDRTAERSRELLSTILATPATTPQGLTSKARIASKLVSRESNGEPFWRDRPLNSVVTDILAQAAKAQELDGELLAAAADFHKFTAEDRAFWEAVGVEADQDNRNACNAEDGIWTRLFAATGRVRDLPAKTLAGFRAKASVVEALIIEQNGPEERGDWNEDIDLAMSLVRDLMGAAA
jgi:hypothetical protein